MLQHIQHTQFVENVLGIPLTVDQSCCLMEGRMPHNLRDRILTETQIYEGFLDDLASKIGGIPKDIAKTFTDAGSVLKFIYNVISDKTGENLKKGIAIIVRNCKALFAQIERLTQKIPEKLRELFNKILDWMKAKVQGLISVQSDTDSTDGIKGEGANWKKFLLLLLAGMVLVFLKQIPSTLSGFSEDVVQAGLTKIWELSQNLISKFLSSPADLLKVVAGAGLVKMLLPLMTLYKTAKMLEPINNDLLDSNAWLRKT